jgi:hypothetical protein
LLSDSRQRGSNRLRDPLEQGLGSIVVDRSGSRAAISNNPTSLRPKRIGKQAAER